MKDRDLFVKRFFCRFWRCLLALICGFAAITTGPSCSSGRRDNGGGTPLLIITTIASSNITSVGATVTWNTNRPADSQVEYGLTTSYGNVVSLTTMVTSHQLTLFGLTADTLYHYKVKSRDASGNLSSSGDLTFTTAKSGSPTPTPTPTPGAPTISSFSASPSSINSGQSSTLSWSVTGATSLKLDPGAFNVTGTTSKSVTPTASTTYILTATNSVGSVNRTVFVTVNVPPPPGVFILAPYTGTFGREQAQILFDRFGFGASPERIDQAVNEGLEETIRKLTTWQSEGNLDAIVSDWVCDGWLSGDSLNTNSCNSSDPFDFHNKLYPDSKLIKFLHSPNQYFYKLILFLHDERLAGSDLNGDPFFYRHVYVEHWNMLLRAAQSGDYTQFMRDWMKDSMGHVFWQDGEDNLKDHPNENFAREFWELGTVGTTHLDGTPVYTDFDIAQAARVHTGYSRSPTLSDAKGAYQTGVFKEADRATGPFFVFNGTPFQATVFTQEDLLQATFRHPRAAEYLAEDLWKEFINLHKDATAIRELAQIIRHFNFNLTPVMQTIMRSKAIYDPGSKETLIKQPIELVIGFLRNFPGYNTTHIHNGDDYTVLAWHTGALDQTFFSPNTIFGWDEKVLSGASYIKLWRDVTNQLLTKTVGSSAEHFARYSLRDHFWTGLSSTDQLIDRLTSCFNVPLNASQRGFLKNYLDTQPRLGESALGSPFPSAGATQQEERIKGAIAILVNQPSYRTK